MSTTDSNQPAPHAEVNDGGCSSLAAGSALTEYQPEMWTVQKDDIYMAIDALEAGLEHARENLTRHDADLGRTTRKNEMWAKTLERDIDLMIRMIDRLRKYSAATMPLPNGKACQPHP